MTIIYHLEKRKKKVLGNLSACANLASLFLEVTLTSLREICGIYYEFKVANQCELEVKQELLKPKVKKLLELFRRTDGTVKLNYLLSFLQFYNYGDYGALFY